MESNFQGKLQQISFLAVRNTINSRHGSDLIQRTTRYLKGISKDFCMHGVAVTDIPLSTERKSNST
ncbi:hypothetical protein KP509_23G017900 [Ceratopteris richardii]|uniref:Uncharacterized protein n=1 Tax=Ceratopteris richardii TaxID=49495 RepID=A0A8T2S0J7_CERRI|nr:hypothetical protein KP509_23G017900 [Ceratopteris richardii]